MDGKTEPLDLNAIVINLLSARAACVNVLSELVQTSSQLSEQSQEQAQMMARMHRNWE